MFVCVIVRIRLLIQDNHCELQDPWDEDVTTGILEVKYCKISIMKIRYDKMK